MSEQASREKIRRIIDEVEDLADECNWPSLDQYLSDFPEPEDPFHNIVVLRTAYQYRSYLKNWETFYVEVSRRLLKHYEEERANRLLRGLKRPSTAF